MTGAWYIYIALLNDARFYTGMTRLLPEERARRHQACLGGNFTRGIKLIRILWSESHPTSESARLREIQIKGWSHAKKQALIEGDLKRLKRLARSRRNR